MLLTKAHVEVARAGLELRAEDANDHGCASYREGGVTTRQPKDGFGASVQPYHTIPP
jgi:hypothetical protein